MYGIKRNIKMKNQVTSRAVKTGANNEGAFRLKSTGYSKYKFPFYDDIPTGDYYSMIKDARLVTTSKGKEALEVCYKMIDAVFCYKLANGILPEDTKPTPYYVKQVYPIDSIFYEAFVDQMAESLGVGDFEISDIIGITEYISLAYDKSDIGSIIKRMPFDFDDFVRVNESDEDAYHEEYDEEEYEW